MSNVLLRKPKQLLLFVSLPFAVAGAARADLNQTCVRTLEWLTDNSDAIYVTRVEAGSQLANGEILRVLKGTRRTLKRPLTFSSFDGYLYWAPPAAGEIRLRFIRGDSELLHEVDLSRPQVRDDFPTLRRILYGVDQYGELVLSQHDLLNRVVDRIKEGPGIVVPARANMRHACECSGVAAPQQFPLETNGVTYVLIVPFTLQRRDHFLKLLRTGNAVDQLRAIHELKQFDDQEAYDAIRLAQKNANGKSISVYYDYGATLVTNSDVRAAARQAIQRIGS